MVENKYKKWIDNYLSENDPYGQCMQATEEMQKEFPELIRVKGWYDCPVWGKREHWWCVDPYENIVDPTAVQFPSQGKFDYIEIPDDHPEPIGKCYNCGSYCYGSSPDFCSDRCQSIYIDYLTNVQ